MQIQNPSKDPVPSQLPQPALPHHYFGVEHSSTILSIRAPHTRLEFEQTGREQICVYGKLRTFGRLLSFSSGSSALAALNLDSRRSKT